MKLIFISDLHLSPKTEAKNQHFMQLLDQWQGHIDALYILGDFFDYWVGDDDLNPFTITIGKHLAKFSQHTPIYFIGGNHDFGLGNDYARRCGITLLPDLSTLKLQEATALLSHGDCFCSLDVNYQKMKKILQHPLLIFILRRIPLSWRYWIKAKLEQKAHASTNSQPQHIYQVVTATIADFAQQAKASIVIHGHTHNPGYYPQTTAAGSTLHRYEIPDWEDRPAGGYLAYTNGHFEIISPKS